MATKIMIRNVPEPLHRALKQLALDTNTSVNSVILTVLAAYVADKKEEGK
jgi:predicted HicB family RNase H-like nuclease